MARVKKVESILKDALLEIYVNADGCISDPSDRCNKLIVAIRQALMYLQK